MLQAPAQIGAMAAGSPPGGRAPPGLERTRTQRRRAQRTRCLRELRAELDRARTQWRPRACDERNQPPSRTPDCNDANDHAGGSAPDVAPLLLSAGRGRQKPWEKSAGPVPGSESEGPCREANAHTACCTSSTCGGSTSSCCRGRWDPCSAAAVGGGGRGRGARRSEAGLLRARVARPLAQLSAGEREYPFES